jgi:hypothetical protein
MEESKEGFKSVQDLKQQLGVSKAKTRRERREMKEKKR